MIDRLFAEGESEYSYPLRMTYRVVDLTSLPEELRGGRFQMMVNVPKKRFKRAVKRVRLRRLMREAWRLQRSGLRDRFLRECPEKVLHVGIVYVGSEEVPFEKVHAKMGKLLESLEGKLFPKSEAEPADAPEKNEEG